MTTPKRVPLLSCYHYSGQGTSSVTFLLKGFLKANNGRKYIVLKTMSCLPLFAVEQHTVVTCSHTLASVV